MIRVSVAVQTISDQYVLTSHRKLIARASF